MLESLHISNYALIDTVDISFHPGFNVITGETGAGKSIILGALSLILGGRSDSRVVRNHDAKSVIEAVFSVDNYPDLREYCLNADIEWDDSHCILRREISPTGRSRAFINDSPVPLNKLQAVALQLVDIHSQHQNQLLARPDFQLQVIDTLAGNAERLERFTVRYNAFREAARALKAMKLRIEKSREDEEFTRYQLEQIEELNLIPGEQDELEKERDVQANLAAIKNALSEITDSLSEGDDNAESLVSRAIDCCSDLGSVLNEADDIPSRLESVKIEINDIASTLSEINENLSADGYALTEIEDRLNAIYTLCRKHHVDNSDDLISLRDQLRARLADLDTSDETVAELERDARRTRALARETAAEISEARKAEALKFGEKLREIAMPLGMKNLQCDIRVEQTDMSPTGIDIVNFMFAFNKNQPPMPVGDTASGGEISRLMLSIKSIIASKMQLPSIIFDEIDTGVSGDVANRMGAMMRDIARNIQVTAITHLPQVAAKGESHYKVYKEDDEDATHTRIALLTPEQRVEALAAMLGGDHVGDAAMANARALLNESLQK